MDITKCVLLDQHTADLGGVNILSGGSLIFDPYLTSKLTLRSNFIKVEGTLRIGSERCRFVGDAEIVLTGE